MTANERTVLVDGNVPAHLIWDAAKHAKSKDVTIRLPFLDKATGAQWRFSNQDVLGVRHHPLGEPNLIIYLKRGFKIIYDTHSREGALIERR